MSTLLSRFANLWPSHAGYHGSRLPRLDTMNLNDQALGDLNLPPAIRARLSRGRPHAGYEWPFGRI